LQKQTKLRVLTLCRSKVTDAGLKRLNALSNLEILDLSHTRVTNAGLKHLERLTRLRGMEVTETLVTEEGATNYVTSCQSFECLGQSVGPHPKCRFDKWHLAST
jgi:hypothetical protein